MIFDDIDDFMKNITREDIDMADKFDNMHEFGQISDITWSILEDYSAAFTAAEDNVIDALESCSEHVKGLLQDRFDGDWAYALYDCDEIYLEAIDKAVDPYIASLNQVARMQNEKRGR